MVDVNGSGINYGRHGRSDRQTENPSCIGDSASLPSGLVFNDWLTDNRPTHEHSLALSP